MIIDYIDCLLLLLKLYLTIGTALESVPRNVVEILKSLLFDSCVAINIAWFNVKEVSVRLLQSNQGIIVPSFTPLSPFPLSLSSTLQCMKVKGERLQSGSRKILFILNPNIG